jgi:hypothetical protein
MTTKFTYLLLAILSFAALVSAQDRQVLAQAERITGDQFPITLQTPQGATVYAAEEPKEAMLKSIDKGLADLFAVARKNNYSKKLNYSDYTVYIARPDRMKDANGKYSPDIAVGAAQYAGTEYDKGGYIYAAGMVVSQSKMAFVIANHTSDFTRVSDLVRFEGEHLVLYQNDRRRYSQTADHSKGGGHPILQ